MAVVTYSAEARAARRADSAEAAIRDALAERNSAKAVNLAMSAVQSELAKLRRRRPADGVLADADLAGILLGIASGLHRHRPTRPADCPAFPRPVDLIAMFDAALARQEGAGS